MPKTYTLADLKRETREMKLYEAIERNAHPSEALADLKQDTRGMKIIDEPFYRSLINLVGEAEAIRWFYHTRVPAFENQTPNEYIAKKGDIGKSVIVEEFYAFLTGQPD